MRRLVIAALGIVLFSSLAEARVVRLRAERREVVLNGRPFGAAGPYEKLIGTVDFGLDPDAPANALIVDLKLAPRNARGEVEASADFYLLKPVDPRRGNGRLFYEVGNRGGKSLLPTFQKAAASLDPVTEAEFGDGALMRQGFTLLWMGWQWDVPEREGVMRMRMPIATENGKPITGLVRGNFILNERSNTAPVADRNHLAYAPLDPASADYVMTVRDDPTARGSVIPRSRWRFVDAGTVALDGGFEPARIYDVVYRSQNPKVVGIGLSGTRDLVSFLKYDASPDNPSPGIRHALAWGVSQSGRFLRHFLYQGFNADERGRKVFDGVFDQVGGAGRGSFNHRFGQASRDALQYFNILFPVDLFPFTDGPETDPDTNVTDGLLARADKSGTTPKVFHLLTNSEYFNRAGSLVHTDLTGTRDADIPPTTRIYMMASAPHGPGPFPPASNRGGGMVGRAALNPLNYSPAVRALFRALDRWAVDDTMPPPSAYPRLADGTLTAPDRAAPEFRRRLGQGDRQHRAARSRQAVRRPRAGGRRGRQRAIGHPSAGHRGAARHARRLELSRGVDRRAGSARRRDWIVHSVSAHARRTRADERSAPLNRRALPESRRVCRQVRRRHARSGREGICSAGGRRRSAAARRRALRVGDEKVGREKPKVTGTRHEVGVRKRD